MADFESAERARKEKRFSEAEPAFRNIWIATVDANAGWRLAYCLRHMGRAQEALKVAEEVLKVAPEHDWIRRELVWCLHDSALKPAVAAGDLSTAAASASRMLELGADGIALERAFFSVIKCAKEKRKWEVVAEWCAKTGAAPWEKKPRQIEGKSIMPLREQFYFAQLKSLVSLRRFCEALTAAGEALKDYPEHPDFLRWEALAFAGDGRLEQALHNLRQLTSRHSDWYFFDSLAAVALLAGQADEAFTAGCRAALGPGKPKAKVRTFERLARAAFEKGDIEAAGLHARLTVALRQQEGWPVGEMLSRLVADINKAVGDEGEDADFGDLFRQCRAIWEAQVKFATPRFTGVVAVLPEGKPFGFIKDREGKEVFFLLKDLPPECRRVGLAVEFAVERNFDKKKNKEGFRAVKVTLAAPPPTPGPKPGATEVPRPQVEDDWTLEF